MKRCIFFSSKNQKKKIQPYFFFPEKVYLHSLNFFGGGHIKNKPKSRIFSKSGSFNLKYVVFFFLPCSVFFFSWKSLSLTHSLISNVCIFLFPVSEKKKYSVFTHSLDFVKNFAKINFSKETRLAALAFSRALRDPKGEHQLWVFGAERTHKKASV